MLDTQSDPGRMRLNWGHRILGKKRRWNEAIQKQSDESRGTQQPWQLSAQDRERWKATAVLFVAILLRHR